MTTPLTSIVILTLNQIQYTKLCLDSIRDNTSEPYELIIVDNGSTDGTLQYLSEQPDVLLIANSENRGFGAGCNQGMSVATGDRILLLNNDTVVSEGWLTGLHRELSSNDKYGIVGPRSNSINGSQQVSAVTYDQDTLAGFTEFARQWQLDHEKQGSDHARLIGFCMLMRREVVDEIGGFDLRFGLGNFEDDDVCVRALVAGWTNRVAHDSFIHHFGSRTFAGEKIDYSQSMALNWKKFAQKWQFGDGDFDTQTGAYNIERIIERWEYSPNEHYAPLVGATENLEQAELNARSTAIFVGLDSVDLAAGEALLTGLFERFDSSLDISIVVRIHPGHDEAFGVLDRVADAAGSELPDVVVVEHDEWNDRSLIDACDLVAVAGRTEWSRSALARLLGKAPISTNDLQQEIDLESFVHQHVARQQ